MSRLRFTCMGAGLAAILLFGGCATRPGGPGLRADGVSSPIVAGEAAVRSHTFEGDRALVFDSVVAVFEDLGYAVHRTDRDSGTITAAGAVEQSAPSLSTEFSRRRQAVASALLERLGERTRVILNFAIRTEIVEQQVEVSASGTGEEEQSVSFQTTILSDEDDTQWEEKTVTEDAPYRDAFERIELAVAGRS